ncbi:MAG: hypothetical protein EYC69_11855 [Bacteroidetes bacterium]|nr:MAG: hypothetical protein EYC69_11855 [Bacteroidota bacterium]
MNRIHVKKLGLAFGLTGTLLYLGCITLMLTVGHDGTVRFFNSLLHGLDVTTIIRMNVPLWEAILGIIQTFILAWLVGACIAGFYNASIKNKV